MGFWSDLWQSTKRVFSSSCPHCKTNDADLPSEKRIITTIVDRHSHVHVHWERDLNGHFHPHSRIVWNKTRRHKCQSCGHQWITHSYNEPFPG